MLVCWLEIGADLPCESLTSYAINAFLNLLSLLTGSILQDSDPDFNTTLTSLLTGSQVWICRKSIYDNTLFDSVSIWLGHSKCCSGVWPCTAGQFSNPRMRPRSYLISSFGEASFLVFVMCIDWLFTISSRVTFSIFWIDLDQCQVFWFSELGTDRLTVARSGRRWATSQSRLTYTSQTKSVAFIY